MAEFLTPKTQQEFEKNFCALKPLMNSTQAYFESSRCLFCYDAPCTTACPAGIDVPLFIRQIYTGNLIGSAKTIYSKNYFGSTCGLVCPTEVLCEGACVLNKQQVRPIEIGRLQNYATKSAMNNGSNVFSKEAAKSKKIAVIGAGPAGISAACELSLLGYSVEIFEALSVPTGLVLKGIAPYKITNTQAVAEFEYLQSNFGFKTHFNSKIETAEQLKKLETDFDAIFLGTGLSGTKKIGIPGENLRNYVGATEFIAKLKRDFKTTEIHKTAVVLGGGNTAMDAASECARMGMPDVILAYRRSKAEMGGYEFEYELAKLVGVDGIFNAAPVEILGKDTVEGVKFVKTQTVEGKVVPIENSEFTIACTLVINATGQQKQTEFYAKIQGLQTDKNGKVLADETTFQVGSSKYFAGGDAVNGGAEVVNAAADGKKAARGIHKFLTK